jgi:chorismate mutase/prephenate dehydratase
MPKARAARATRPGTAAIAGEAAAEVYGLQKLVADIEDRPDNTTRFLVIGRELLAASGSDKTSLLLSTRDSDDAGALQKLLAPLAQHQVNMSRIESRPSRRRKWHYVFFVDVDGHASDKKVALALAELQKRAQLFRILGSYPKAIL